MSLVVSQYDGSDEKADDDDGQSAGDDVDHDLEEGGEG